jgi:uncharacterized protein DUF4160
MPLIQRFLNCAIYINTRDHNPPHFHVRTNDGRDALVEVETFAIRSNDVRRRDISEALTWAINHSALLLLKFKEYNP